ncbi:hypothetical protein PG993_010753 [Apiospora rasikravindrae]|uniref:Transposase n=1 Tax=Apiospora rasikravindrae TaxID=990691 RepID=A0ABR1SCA4_9PEZI
MAMANPSPASPCASPPDELVIEISDDDLNRSDEGDDYVHDAQYEDAVNFENTNETIMDMVVPGKIDCPLIWEASTPARHKASQANHMPHADSDDMSDIERASFTDVDCEDVQVAEIQNDPVIPSNTNLVLEELVSMRARLANVEAQLRHLSKAEKPKGTSHSAKRKQSRSPTPPRKRQRKGREVNIRVTRAWLHLDEEPESLEYVWQHDRDGGGYWRRECGPESERVDGNYLLSYGSDLRVQIRANGDWRLAPSHGAVE